uniref:Uncharacterized protein n=1 Tax=Setaria italica TaxID=4555 RepID=K3Y484_SETIT
MLIDLCLKLIRYAKLYRSCQPLYYLYLIIEKLVFLCSRNKSRCCEQ